MTSTTAYTDRKGELWTYDDLYGHRRPLLVIMTEQHDRPIVFVTHRVIWYRDMFDQPCHWVSTITEPELADRGRWRRIG